MSKLGVAAFTNLGYHIHARGFRSLNVDMRGKTVVVTGASGGLGLETSRRLAEMGAHIVMVGRSELKLHRACALVGEGSSVELADLSLLQEVRSLARRILDSGRSVDVLVNNVGVLLPDRRVTSEGLEVTFATNLAGQFLLTNLLLPRLVESKPSRVIFVSSGGMYTARIEPNDLQFERRRYTGTGAYAGTKRGQVILTEMWTERFPDRSVAFHAMHPGWVRTEGVARSLPTFNTIMRPLLRTPAQGADTIVWLAAADQAGQTTGGFWFDRTTAPTHLSEGTKESPEARRQLWETLARITDSDVKVP